MSSSRNPVMIIDDDINLMNAMSLVLKKYDIDLVAYTEPLSALQELKQNKYDILIINYILSGTKGDKMISMIREFDKDIYIILMSSHKQLAPSIDIMRSLDIQAFFEKGSNFDDLILLIEGGYKSLAQLNSIKQLSIKLDEFGIEFATAIRNMIGARDNYTGSHSNRVASYTKLFLEYLDINPTDQKNVYLAAHFHDIGKIGISDSVLLKNGKLTDEEYAHIKLHPVIGENILSTSFIFKDTLPIIRHHHERIDGKGYPDGLSGMSIPYYARLLSVCDTFDAITSVRVYRDQATIEDAIKELERVAGTQLDEKLVKSFIQMVEKNTNKIKEIQESK